MAAVIVGPSLDNRHPWINYRSLASALAPGKVETFDWAQRYGPLHWPRTRKAVLEIQASAVGLLEGREPGRVRWAGLGRGAGARPNSLAGRGSAHRRSTRWTADARGHFALDVHRRRDRRRLGRSAAGRPRRGRQRPELRHLARHAPPGARRQLSSHCLLAHPSSAQLALAGASYPRSLQNDYLSIEVPEPEGSSRQILSSSGGDQGSFPQPRRRLPRRDSLPRLERWRRRRHAVAAAMRASPYASVYALAQRLARGAATPYAFAERVQQLPRAMASAYDEHPLPSRRTRSKTFL